MRLNTVNLYLSGSECGVQVPKETNISRYHSVIKSLLDTETGKLDFYMYKLTKSKHQLSYTKATIVNECTTPIKLKCGTLFSTGNIRWLVSSVPKHQLLLSKAFALVRNGSYLDFVETLYEIDIWNENIASSELCDGDGLLGKTIDISAEEDFNFLLCADNPVNKISDSMFPKNNCFQCTESNQYNHFSLLHVAVDYNRVDIVECLLKRKPNVRFTIFLLLTVIFTFLDFLILYNHVICNNNIDGMNLVI